jgi:hypothetical protein
MEVNVQLVQAGSFALLLARSAWRNAAHVWQDNTRAQAQAPALSAKLAVQMKTWMPQLSAPSVL